MTRVRFRLREQELEGQLPARVLLTLRPVGPEITRRRLGMGANNGVLIPAPLQVSLDATLENKEIELFPCDGTAGWAWGAIVTAADTAETLLQVAFLVPASGLQNFEDVGIVDPRTLVPGASDLDIWAELRDDIAAGLAAIPNGAAALGASSLVLTRDGVPVSAPIAIPPGLQGTPATITSATATPLAPGATPTVTVGGTPAARTFTFGIPSGLKGDPGTVTGANWADLAGKPSTFTPEIGTTATTAAPGTHPAVTATDAAIGHVELATVTEVQTGTDTTRAVTPAGLAARTATATRLGIVELATDVEAQTGTDTARAVTPANLTARTATDARTGLVELATVAEVTAYTDTARALTPAGLGAALDARVGILNPIAVIIGNSHSAPDTAMWHTEFGAAMGWEIKNFAVSGMAFTFGTSQYNTQVTLAAGSGMTAAEKLRVREVLVVDAGNDIRNASTTAASVKTAATALFAQIKTAFPAARITLVPVLWGTMAGTGNETQVAKESLVATVQGLREAAASALVGFVDHSWTWHWGRSDLMVASDIHYTPAGKSWIAAWLLAFFRGSSTRYDLGWTNLTAGSGITFEAFERYPIPRARRVGDDVNAMGRFWNATAKTSGDTIATLPEGMRPPWDVLGTLTTTGTSPVTYQARAFPNGEVRALQAIPATPIGQATLIDFDFRVL